MDRIEAMMVFRAVVDAGSLSAASRQLHMPLATVSRKLSDLEAHLKARLLQRSTRQLVLTDAGAAYLIACRRILDDVEEAERSAAGEFSAPKGELVITAPIAFGRLHVVPITAEFLRAYPDVDVRLVLGDRMFNLLDEHVDLAVRIGELPDSTLVASRVGATRHVVSGSPAYLDRHGRPQQLTDLSGHDIITFDHLTGPGAWKFRMGSSEASVPVRARMTVNTADAAVAAAIAGAGLTRTLCYQLAEHVRRKTLELVLPEFEPVPWPINLVYLQQGRLPLKVRAFLDFVTPRLRARLADTAPLGK
ncbi:MULTISPECIES: LysR family transcriptional regulator [Lysobacter]|jgi:DNA-binding transcriptional LysR family regulator|uniref:LysR family transcriptional regulator n=1 Tax=Lysobacter gummosus TaxID=262324 RepID=A0ABY3XI80_9GAMM|nr:MULTISPECIES: LysR family transcriptional regulator [Lysobacter]ALN90874.1 bacterial regulatory helix-turn-helix, lysR family protein [Lysobacter gummosus]KQZ55593.1 LysR family transcriptional regulator [Lysobacter sp. Root559]KRA70694.1 LysR family transcriptional regulator [Lysobacter sp. Root667]KRC31526.1 LysR family transcriptional regulator [Lysobacter sp. Root76]KRD65433.1 LysR family transcriptional regulator [Lysobacter sp. Root96]